jgi:hypothetical protein
MDEMTGRGSSAMTRFLRMNRAERPRHIALIVSFPLLTGLP